MSTVILSRKYKVVIPPAVREGLDLKPGQELRVIQYAGRVELIPVRPVGEMRGFIPGLDTDVEREDDRALESSTIAHGQVRSSISKRVKSKKRS